MRARHVLFGIVFLVAVAGCGGSDDADDTTAGGGGAATTAPAANERLSQGSWDEYVAARDQAQQVNQKALKTFSKCRDLVARNVESQAIQQCFGTTTSDVVTAGTQFESVLAGFKDEVGGACATALTNFAGTVKLYVASVNALETEADTTPNATQVDTATEGLKAVRTAGPAFEAACKPTA